MTRSTFWRIACMGLLLFWGCFFVLLHSCTKAHAEDGCLFTMTVIDTTTVYNNDRSTPLWQLYPGDKVCIFEINEGWFAAHWVTERGHEHGGWLHSNVHKDRGPLRPVAPDLD